jgi:endonuclease YncB( thermonuclease family)
MGEQVRRSLAWHYTRDWHEQPPQVRGDYARAERQARDERIGLWTIPQPVAPWDYRRERSSTAR